MNFSKLGRNDLIALGAAVVVVITAIISIGNEWGIIMALSLFAGLGAAFVVLQPQVAPAMKLPVARGLAVVGLGAAAAVITGLVAVDWLGWITDHLVTFDTLQFLAGFVAAIVMLYAGWTIYQSERTPAGATSTTSPAA